jgi:hypothetical protein
MGVDEARDDDAVGCAHDACRPLADREVLADRGDPVTLDEDVGHPVGHVRFHRDDGAPAYERALLSHAAPSLPLCAEALRA